MAFCNIWAPISAFALAERCTASGVATTRSWIETKALHMLLAALQLRLSGIDSTHAHIQPTQLSEQEVIGMMSSLVCVYVCTFVSMKYHVYASLFDYIGLCIRVRIVFKYTV